MKTVRFTYRHDGRRPDCSGYKCSEPNDQDGEYVKADIASDLLAACEMQAAISNALSLGVHADWDYVEKLLRSHGYTGDCGCVAFVMRFRDAAIAKARTNA